MLLTITNSGKADILPQSQSKQAGKAAPRKKGVLRICYIAVIMVGVMQMISGVHGITVVCRMDPKPMLDLDGFIYTENTRFQIFMYSMFDVLLGLILLAGGFGLCNSNTVGLGIVVSVSMLVVTIWSGVWEWAEKRNAFNGTHFLVWLLVHASVIFLISTYYFLLKVEEEQEQEETFENVE